MTGLVRGRSVASNACAHAINNTDPWATAKTADNHWVQTGSHVVIVGAAAKTMAAGYQKTSDPDPTKPHVMWPDTPYGHLMIPVK